MSLDMIQKSFDDQPRGKDGRWTKGGTVSRLHPNGIPADIRHMGDEAFWDAYKVMGDQGKHHEFILDEDEIDKWDPQRIWTLVDEEDGSVTAEAGYQPGAFGYLVTKHPWTTGDEKGMYAEAPDDVSKRIPVKHIPAVAGAHWTVAMSRVADRIEPYAARRRRPIPRPMVDRHLPTVKRVGGKLVQTGRQKAAETARAISYDLSSLNDKDKLIREVATGQGRVGKSWIPNPAGAGTKARTAARFFEGQYKPASQLTRAERNRLVTHIASSKTAREGLKGATIRRDGPGGKISRVNVQPGAFRGRYGPDQRAMAYAERAIKRKGHEFSLKRTGHGAPPNIKHTGLAGAMARAMPIKKPTRGQLKPLPPGAKPRQWLPEPPIKKSFSPRVGWKPISQMTPVQRAAIRGSHAKMHRVNPGDRKFQRTMTDYHQDLKARDPKSFGVKANQYSFNLGQGHTLRYGSKSNGKSYIEGEAQTRHVANKIQAHEEQHAKVKRSSYRLNRQIHSNPEKLMREEARADYFSQGHYRDQRGPATHRGGYGLAAEWRDRQIKNPNRPAKGSKQAVEAMRMWDETARRASNQEAYRTVAGRALGRVGYQGTLRSPERTDRAVDAYRGLQDSLKAKGVRPGTVGRRQVQKSFGARLGAEYTVRMLKAAEKVEPKAPVKVPKGKLKPISRTRATATHAARKMAANKLVKTATNPVHLFKDNEFNEQNVLLFKRHVEKSFFPGRGYVPALQVPKRGLREYAHGKRASEAARVRAEAQEHFEGYKKTHDLVSNLADAAKGRKTNPKNKATELKLPHLVMNRMVGGHAKAFAYRTGGKKGGRYLFTRPGADQGTINHELAHLEPKRSSYRMHQVAHHPVKRIREEARADMHGGPGSYYRDRHEPRSAYVQAARSEVHRRRVADIADNGGGTPGMFSRENVREFQNVQDRIYNTGGMRTPKIKAGAPEGGQRPVKHYVIGGGVAAAGAGGAGYAVHRKRQKVGKALDMHEGLHSLVSKMGPDQSELHVAGSSDQRRKTRLRKLPPDAVRRTR